MSFLENALRSNNLRLTEPRRLIYNIIAGSEHSLTAQEICKIVSDESNIKTDPASVYRNLAVFTKAGLTHSLPNGKYVACKHDLITKCEKIHIVSSCVECGKTAELKENEEAYKTVRKLKKLEMGFKNISTITLEGKCQDCSIN